MIGFILAIGSSFLSEVSDIIAKKKMEAGQVSVYTTAFLISIFGIFFLTVSALVRGNFHFSFDSLPTLGLRIFLEIILTWITITAIARSNRSTFGFIRTLTIPLLLIADIVIGYTISFSQIIGIVIISGVIALFIFYSGKMEKKGLGLLLLSSILPVATLSLYKYDITNFNSVEAEQIILSLVLLVFFFLMAFFKAKENPLTFLVKPIFFFQSLLMGLASAVGSFAYLFLPPSVIVAALRSSSVLLATISGNLYFKEKKLLVKILVALGIVLGLAFLV